MNKSDFEPLEQARNKCNQKKWWGILLLILLLMIGSSVMTAFFLIPEMRENEIPVGQLVFDDNAQSGTLPGKTPEEIQKELNRIVEEGMFNISIASIIVFPEGTAKGHARIENIEANHYHMQVTITLDDGTEVYQSGGLKPGQYVEYITLSEDLPAGEYAATAVFTAHHTEDLSEVGQAAAKITLIVEE